MVIIPLDKLEFGTPQTKNPRKIPSGGREFYLRHWKEIITFQHEPERLCSMVVVM
jgi:hypothetical protein